MPGIQPMDLGQAALGPMALAQKMDIEALEAPSRIEHSKSLANLQRAQAAEAEMRVDKDRKLMSLAQGWTPKPGASQEDNLVELGMMGLKAGSLSLAEHAFGAAQQAGQRKGMEDYYRAQADQRNFQVAQAKQQAILGAYSSVRDFKDTNQILFARKMALQQGQGLPGIEAATAEIEQLISQHGPQALRMLHDMSVGQKQVGAEASREAAEQIRLAELRRRQRNDEVLRKVRLARLGIAERTAAAREKAGGGKDVATPTDRQTLAAKHQLGIIGVNEAIESDEEFTAYAREVASQANLLRKNNPALTEGESIQRAHNALMRGGAIADKPRKILGVEVGKKGGYDPTKGGVADVTSKEEYEKLPKGAKYRWQGKEYTKE